MHFSVVLITFTVIIIIINEKEWYIILKESNKKDIGLCTEQIIASISLAY